MPGLPRTAADALVAKLYGMRRRNFDGAAPHHRRASQQPAARLILLCESELGIERGDFRTILVEAVGIARQTGADYFTRHPNVFKDWLYGIRPVPPWVTRLVCDLGRGLLRVSWISGRARRSIHHCLAGMLVDLAGGQDEYEWLLSAMDDIGALQKEWRP